LRSRNTLARKRPSPLISYAKSVSLRRANSSWFGCGMIGSSSAIMSAGEIGLASASSGWILPSLRTSGGMFDERWRSDAFDSTIKLNSRSIGAAPVWTFGGPLDATGAAGAAAGLDAAGAGASGTGAATAVIAGAGGAGAGTVDAPPEGSGTMLTAISDPFLKIVTLKAPLGD